MEIDVHLTGVLGVIEKGAIGVVVVARVLREWLESILRLMRRDRHC